VIEKERMTADELVIIRFGELKKPDLLDEDGNLIYF
jgi:hypothetical protein